MLFLLIVSSDCGKNEKLVFELHVNTQTMVLRILWNMKSKNFTSEVYGKWEIAQWDEHEDPSSIPCLKLKSSVKSLHQ